MADEGTPKDVEGAEDGTADRSEGTQLTSVDQVDESDRTQQIDSAALLALQEEKEGIADEPTDEHHRIDPEKKSDAS